MLEKAIKTNKNTSCFIEPGLEGVKQTSIYNPFDKLFRSLEGGNECE